MGDDMIRETYRALRWKQKQDAAAARIKAMADFIPARELAEQNGKWVLRQHTIAHYSLEHIERRCRLNVFPGNRRLYWDKERPKGPHLKVETGWTLVDIVRAAISREDWK